MIVSLGETGLWPVIILVSWHPCSGDCELRQSTHGSQSTTHNMHHDTALLNHVRKISSVVWCDCSAQIHITRYRNKSHIFCASVIASAHAIWLVPRSGFIVVLCTKKHWSGLKIFCFVKLNSILGKFQDFWHLVFEWNIVKYSIHTVLTLTTHSNCVNL